MSFRRDPFRELWSEVSRISDEFNRTIGNRVGFGNPAVNSWADENNVYAEADLPGLDPQKIDVTVTEGNKLSITGEREIPTVEKAVWVRQERSSGKFSREFELPVAVDADRIVAKYENGVLKLTMPKSAAAKPRKITVS